MVCRREEKEATSDTGGGAGHELAQQAGAEIEERIHYRKATFGQKNIMQNKVVF